jgi:electron transfer flavoprotein alpha subunit
MRARRDPRAERQARLVPAADRPRFALAPAHLAPPSPRPRRDPRALRRSATVIGAARLRIDWRAGRMGGAASAGRIEPAAGALPEAGCRVIADPAFLVFAVADHPGGALSDHDRQVIGVARQLADAGGGAVVVLAAGGGGDGLDAAGADRVMMPPAADAPPAEYDPEGRAAAVLAAIGAFQPRHVLFPESPDGGADLARRIAAAAGERLFGGVEAMAGGRVCRRARGGASEMASTPPPFMSIAENAFSPHDGPRHEARAVEAPAVSPARRVRNATTLPLDAGRLSLADADFILSGGNGVTDWASFAELAAVLGATPGGSRVVCDEGHLPRDRQVGASGSVVTARCYLAFGIAGAPQHLQGITEVGHVVAVNTDLHAEMIKRADLAIIADAQEVMPALIRHASALARAPDAPAPGAISPRHCELAAKQSTAACAVPAGSAIAAPLASSPPKRGSGKLRLLDLERPRQLFRRALPGRDGVLEAPSRGNDDRGQAPHEASPAAGTVFHSAGAARRRCATRDDEDTPPSASGHAKPCVAVLLSVGRHPASGRARRSPLDARALEMALGLPGAEVHAIHAGDPAEPALRDYLGMGLERLAVLSIPHGGDPVPALAAHLEALAPDVVLCGNRAEGGEDSGMLPYLLAQALGFAMVADVAAIHIDAGEASLIQARPRGRRRLIETPLPVIAAVSAAAPAPRQSAFARARRGVIEALVAEAPDDTWLDACEIRPWRARPKRMRLASAGSAADRLKSMTETRSGEGAVMVNPSAGDAARAIYDYLLEKRIIEERS